MPFTIAHPAAVLPLRRWLDVTALACGAVAPDFEYFARLRMQSDLSHTAFGVAAFDVPVALALFVVVHALVKRPLTDALPEMLATRLDRWADAPAPALTPASLGRLLIAVAVGVATHLAWDAFTHRTGFIVERSSILSAVASLPVLGDVAVYRMLQHASTLFGLAAIAIALHRVPRSPPRLLDAREARRRAHARVAFAVAVPLAAIVAIAWCHASLEGASLARSYGHLIAAACGGAIVGVVIASLLVTALAPRPTHEG